MSQDGEAQGDSLNRSPADQSGDDLSVSPPRPIDQFVHSIYRPGSGDVVILNSPFRFLFSIFDRRPDRSPRRDQDRHNPFHEPGRGTRLFHLPGWLTRRLTFYRLHLAYFVIIAWIASICLRLFPKSSSDTTKLAFIDCIYNAVSAVCTTGLVSVRMSSFSTPDNVLLLILMTLGSPIFTSVLPIYIRLFQFRRNIAEMEYYLSEVAADEPDLRSEIKPEVPPAVFEIPPAVSEVPPAVSEAGLHHVIPRKRSDRSLPSINNVDIAEAELHCVIPRMRSDMSLPSISSVDIADHRVIPRMRSDKSLPSISSVDIADHRVIPRMRSDKSLPSISSVDIANHRVIPRMLSDKSMPTISNVDIDTKLRDALRAVQLEHDALVSLNWIVSVYFLVWIVLGFLVLEVMLQCSRSAMAVLADRSINHLFFSLFASISTFTNSGILPLDDSVAPFRENNGILLWLSLLILVGNTLFAPCLRATIWCLKAASTSPDKRPIYDYLLAHPRRCFTHLFPRNQSVWLVVTVMGFNAFESGFYYILSWRSQAVEGLNAGQKVVNGIFQSITTRSAGETVVSISALSPPMLVLYIAMMYIAVYPVYLSRQNSQAQEVSLEEMIEKKKMKSGKEHYKSKTWGPKKKKQKKDDKAEFSITAQSKRLIATDTAYLFISIFVLCIIENGRINDDPLNFSIFNIIFEVISAYGNVGLSVGYSCPILRKLTSKASDTTCVDVPYSFSGTWSIPGKLLMIVIMFLGRHRGLPDNMDLALQIPKSFFTTTKRDEQSVFSSDQVAGGGGGGGGGSLDHLHQQQQQQHQLVEIHPDCLVEVPAAVDLSVVDLDSDGVRQPDYIELQILDRAK